MKRNLILVAVFLLIGALFILKNFQSSSDKQGSVSTREERATKSPLDHEHFDESLIPEGDHYAGISSYDRFKDSYRVSLYEQIEASNFEEAYQSVLDDRNKFNEQIDFEVFLKAVLKQWGKHDPARVLALIKSGLPLDKQEIPALLQSVAVGFAKQDSRAAFQWLETAEQSGLIPDATTGDIIYTRILQEHAAQYPGEVVEIFHEIETEQAQLYVITPLLKALTKTDFTAATEFVLSIPGGEVRDKAMEDIIKYNNKDPQFLADIFLLNQDMVSKAEIADSLNKLAENNFEAAKKTLLSAEKAGDNEYILTRFASSQAFVDGERMHSLVEDIQDPILRDNVVGNLADSYIKSNPGIGISVAADIKDEQKRIRTVSGIIEKTSDENILAFRDYFDEFEDMPAFEKQIYLVKINQRLAKIEGE